MSRSQTSGAGTEAGQCLQEPGLFCLPALPPLACSVFWPHDLKMAAAPPATACVSDKKRGRRMERGKGTKSL